VRLRDRPGPVLPAEIRERIARLRPAGLRGSDSASGPPAGALVQPLGLTGRPRAYLVVSAPRPWDAGNRGAVATAVALLSLDAERRADALTAAREIRTAALRLLLGGQTGSAWALLALPSAATGPVREQERHHVVRIRAAGDPEPLLEAVERWAAAEPAVALTATVDGHLIALVRQGADLAPLVNAVGAAGGQAGVGAPEPPGRVADSDATALAALARTTSDRPVARWNDVVDGGVAALLGGPAGEAFARSVLGALAEGSAENERLLATLDRFHTHHGRLGDVAASLGVHRNTVRRRLRRVEELTGRSLADARDRVELWVAAEVLRSASRPGRITP
jgi:purine catabolism regulator